MTKVISLVENRSEHGCRTAHGLSLYIETAQHKILFDVSGDSAALEENAQRLGVDLSQVDTILISHGHKDHGGALGRVMELNSSAKIYIQRGAFLPHFSRRSSGMADIGLDVSLMSDHRVVLLDGGCEIDEELTLFCVEDCSVCPSGANGSLYEGASPDKFRHEQNLIIRDTRTTLIMGCGHCGVVNIMRAAERYAPDSCIGGFHLTSPSAGRDEPRELIDQIIEELRRYQSVTFYTCHCTGENVFNYMSSKMSNVNYLSCGMTLWV